MRDRQHITDKLVRQVLDGDVDRFGEIVDQYEADVAKVVNAMLFDRQDAQQLIQDTFIQAFQNLERYECGRPFGYWIKAVARNLVRDRSRRLKSRGKYMDLYREHLLVRQELHADNDAEEERAALLKGCMSKLSTDISQALQWRYWEGLSLADIAEKIGRTLPATQKYLSRARLSLRDCVELKLRTSS